MLNNSIIVIDSSVSEEAKLSAMKVCDSAFTKSVVNRSDFKELFQKINKYAEFFIALKNDKPVGYAAMYANDMINKEAFITLIVVHSDHQGEHIGSKLMCDCINTSRRKGMESIRLEVLDIDKGAQAFYSKQGFLEDGRCSSESIYMKKIISVE